MAVTYTDPAVTYKNNGRHPNSSNNSNSNCKRTGNNKGNKNDKKFCNPCIILGNDHDWSECPKIRISSLSITTVTELNDNMSDDGAARTLAAYHKKWMQLLEKNPDLQIAVIGGGMYGCHFANAFKSACKEVSNGETKIAAKLTIFEKDDVLFSQASGKNSFRIHKGFHYPRTGDTRRMCYGDHKKFCLKYPHFFRNSIDNIPAFGKVFAVAKDEKTKLDYEAMKCLLMGSRYEEGKSMWDEIEGELWNRQIRRSTDADFKRKQMKALGFNPDLIDGAFLVQVEPILFADKPRKWFTEQFMESPYIDLAVGKRVDRVDIQENKSKQMMIHQQSFNLVLNCTYNQAIPMHPKEHKAFYDLCISVIVAEKSNHKGIPAVSFGIFDGPFPSLEPYDFASIDDLPSELKRFSDQNLFQIFDVELSSIGQCRDPLVAYDLMASWESKKKEGDALYLNTVQSIWDKCKLYFPRLEHDFEFAGTWFALKTRVEDENTSRPIIVVPDESVDQKGRFLQIFRRS